MEGLLIEAFVGCLLVIFSVFGYINDLDFLTIAMGLPAVVCIISISITIQSIISEIRHKRSQSKWFDMRYG